MKLNKDIRKYIILSGIFLLLVISFFTAANILIRRPGVQQYLLQKVCVGYGLESKTGKIELDIFGASGVKIHDVEICRVDKLCSAGASSITINFSIIRLLMGALIPTSVDIKHPVINISEEYLKSFKNSGNGGGPKTPIFCRGGVNNFNIEDGEIFIDGPSGIVVNKLSAKIGPVEGTINTYKVSGSAKISYKGKKSDIILDSTVDVNTGDMLKSVFSASLKTKNTPLSWIPDHKKIEFKKGYVNSDLNITGDSLNGIYMGGSLNFKSSGFILFHKDRSKDFDIPEVNGVIDLTYKDRVIRIDSLNMKNRDLNIDLEMILDLTTRGNPYFKLTGKSDFMSVETFSRNFPSQITKPWLKDKLFPMFEEGRVRIDQLVLDGTVDQFRHIRDEGNHSIFGMSLTCRSFILSNMGIQIPVTGVPASVDISDGNLKISGLSGTFGDSVIKEGSVFVDGMTGGHPVFTVFVDGDFDIRELMSLRKLDVMPEKAWLLLEKNSELEGRLSAKTYIGYSKDRKSRWTLSGDYFFRDTLYHKRYLGLPVRFTRLDFHFPEEGDNTFSGQGDFGNTKFNVTGTTEKSEGKIVMFKHADITADADMNQLIKAGLKSESSPCKFSEFLPLNIAVDKQEDTFTYKGSVDTEKLIMESKNFIFNSSGKNNGASFDVMQHISGRLDIKSILFRFGNSSLFLSGEYNLKSKILNTLKITSEDLSLGDLRVTLKENGSVLWGTLKGSLDLDFPEKGMKGIYINGSIGGNNISFITDHLPLPVSKWSFLMDLSGKKGFINQFDMTFGEHPLRMKGVLQGWDAIKGDLLLTSDYIDLTEIILNEKKRPAGKTPSLFESYNINMKLNSSRGIWRKLEFSRLNAEIVFSDDNIAIKNAEAELEKGDVSASGMIERTGSGKIDISSRINLAEQPIDKLISDTGFGDKGIKGTLSLKSSCNIKGPKKNGMLKNLSGKIESMSLIEGLHRNSKVFIRILDGLNIPDKFRERSPDMQGEGFAFKSIEGTGIIEKGILKTEEFIIRSPAFNAVGSGEENLYNQTHNIRILVQPLNTLDYIINKIPILGPIISNDNETIFTVGYDVKGPWKKPDLDLVPSENLKSLAGLLKRAFLTPARLIKKVSNASKNSKNKTEPEVMDGSESTEGKEETEAETPW